MRNKVGGGGWGVGTVSQGPISPRNPQQSLGANPCRGPPAAKPSFSPPLQTKQRCSSAIGSIPAAWSGLGCLSGGGVAAHMGRSSAPAPRPGRPSPRLGTRLQGSPKVSLPSSVPCRLSTAREDRPGAGSRAWREVRAAATSAAKAQALLEPPRRALSRGKTGRPPC